LLVTPRGFSDWHVEVPAGAIRKSVPPKGPTQFCAGMAEPHRFAHNHGKELQFHDGCAAPGRLACLFLVFCPPFDVFKGIAG
jgi:hypothetical protein